MRVKELISELEDWNPESMVVIDCGVYDEGVAVEAVVEDDWGCGRVVKLQSRGLINVIKTTVEDAMKYLEE